MPLQNLRVVSTRDIPNAQGSIVRGADYHLTVSREHTVIDSSTMTFKRVNSFGGLDVPEAQGSISRSTEHLLFIWTESAAKDTTIMTFERAE